MLVALPRLPRRPAVLDDLLGASHGKGSWRDVLRDCGARSDVGALANGDGRHQARVGPDEGVVVDPRLVLGDSVVVAGDRPGADVDVLTDRGVSDVGKVRHLRPTADLR